MLYPLFVLVLSSFFAPSNAFVPLIHNRVLLDRLPVKHKSIPQPRSNTMRSSDSEIWTRIDHNEFDSTAKSQSLGQVLPAAFRRVSVAALALLFALALVQPLTAIGWSTASLPPATSVAPLGSSSLSIAFFDWEEPFYFLLQFTEICFVTCSGIVILIVARYATEEVTVRTVNFLRSMEWPGKAMVQAGGSLSKYSTNILGPGTATIRLRLALNVPNRRDSLSLLSSLCQVTPTASPRSILERVLSKPSPPDKEVGREYLANEIALELLQRKSCIYAASGEYIHNKNDEKARSQFLRLSVEECQKHIIAIEESTGKPELETTSVVSLVVSTSNRDWAKKARRIRTLADLEELLLGIVMEGAMKEHTMRSTVLLTPANNETTISRMDLATHFPELKVLL
jgi:Protein of unknown function (DUF1517)